VVAASAGIDLLLHGRVATLLGLTLAEVLGAERSRLWVEALGWSGHGASHHWLGIEWLPSRTHVQAQRVEISVREAGAYALFELGQVEAEQPGEFASDDTQGLRWSVDALAACRTREAVLHRLAHELLTLAGAERVSVLCGSAHSGFRVCASVQLPMRCGASDGLRSLTIKHAGAQRRGDFPEQRLSGRKAIRRLHQAPFRLRSTGCVDDPGREVQQLGSLPLKLLRSVHNRLPDCGERRLLQACGADQGFSLTLPDGAGAVCIVLGAGGDTGAGGMQRALMLERVALLTQLRLMCLPSERTA